MTETSEPYIYQDKLEPISENTRALMATQLAIPLLRSGLNDRQIAARACDLADEIYSECLLRQKRHLKEANLLLSELQRDDFHP